MGFSLRGYVLEKVRVSSANSPFTVTPDNIISSQPTFDAYYTSAETAPRNEYLVQVLVDGDLSDAEFGWTKNEVIQRFDYDGAEQRFRPMRGSTRLQAGPLDATVNTTRIRVPAPLNTASISPYRLAVGSSGSGIQLNVVTVANNGAFTAPAAGTVELSLATGDLNWNVTDISNTYLGQNVFFQQQQFFTSKEATGSLGIAGTDTIILNPIPGLGVGVAFQKPLLRFGFGLHLTPVDVATEASFSFNPLVGTFEWARTTGLVKFNSTDLAANLGEPVYYDGVLFETGRTLPRQMVGTINAPTPVVGLPAAGGDLIFRALPASFPTGTATYPSTTLLNDPAANFVTAGVRVGDVAVLTSGTYLGSRRPITNVTTTQLTVAPGFPAVTGPTTYRIETGIVQFDEVKRIDGVFFDPLGVTNDVQVSNTTGAVQFSFLDKVLYIGRAVELIFGDLLIERGISVRFFRTPVDPRARDNDAKDVSAFFTSTEGLLADPVIGVPFIFLPVLPVDDPAYPMTFEIQQGTGTFTGVLPRLDVLSPPTGIGYTIDFDQKRLNYAIRKEDQVVSLSRPQGYAQLPDPLVTASNIILELDEGAGYAPLVLGTSALLDAPSGIVSFIEIVGVDQTTGSTGSFTSPSTTFTDTGKDFSALNVQPGDSLLVLSGLPKGVYEVGTVGTTTLTVNPAATVAGSGLSYEILRGKEVLADRFFEEVSIADPNTKVEKLRPLGTISNSPRLNINVGFVAASRFRFGDTTFSTTVTTVANDGAFTAPGSLASGVVEVSLDTGNLNFSQVDVTTGGTLFWARLLIEQKDYRISAPLGFIQTIERLLSTDELFLTYSSLLAPTVIIEERATFRVRKELTTHASPTNVIPFNPLGRAVAAVPAAEVFRGGRPQSASQVSIDVVASTITFLPDVLPTPGGAFAITDALPHGSIVNPNERVYIDYFIYGAIGGENTTTVLQLPINLAAVQIVEGQTSFKIKGDRTASFPMNRLLRIASEEVYYLAAPTYDVATDETTVNLLAPQTFRNTLSQPKLFVSSGTLRLTSSLFNPSYFAIEAAVFDNVPRGMTTMRVQGDRSATYVSGSIIYLSGGTPAVADFYFVTGSKYDTLTDRTEIAISLPTARQYNATGVGAHVFRRSVRPLFESATTRVNTSKSPVLTEPFTVVRQLEGQAGQILVSPDDYEMGAAGNIEFTSPLVAGEEFAIFYTRYRVVRSGAVRATYTASLAPSDVNGLANQILVGTFTTLSPDSMFYRVEPIATVFLPEIAKQYKDEAKAAVPSGGPRLENASQPKLHEQGRESIFYQEGRLANEDFIARYTLKYYNDIIHLLEDVLQNMDGRLIGDYDGRFKFDGTTGTQVANFAAATNQIDDSFRVTNFPLDFSPPLLPFKFFGTLTKAYEPSRFSRFYATFRSRFGYTVVGFGTGAETGEEMLDTGSKGLTGISPSIYRRYARARIIEAVPFGATTLQVDTTDPVTTLPGPFRPRFRASMMVVVKDAAGVYYISELTPATVTSLTPTSLTLDTPAPIGGIPIGATVYMSFLDILWQKNYRPGFDIYPDYENGVLLYTKPFFPFDGTIPGIPPELNIQDPDAEELLQMTVTISNRLTAPEKIAALYGGAVDDDGDQRYPLINPSFNREAGTGGPSYLANELAALGAGGTILTNTEDPYQSVGSLDVTRTILTNGVAFPAPVPQVWDLVRITSGLNGVTTFHRIISTTATTVTVETAFASQDAGFNYFITTSTNLIPSGTVATFLGTTLTDVGVNFLLAGVEVGHTVVRTQAGAGQGERRQVASVDSATQITLTSAFSTVVPGTYRICRPLNTYSDIALATTSATGEATALTNELTAIDAFYTAVFTDRLSPTSQAGTVAGSTLTGSTTNAVPGDFVYVTPPQALNEGIYLVTRVNSPTSLDIQGVFPGAGAVTYRIVKAFGVGETTLVDLFSVRQDIVTFLASSATWNTLVSTAVTVDGDAGAFARGFLPVDLSSRVTDATARQTLLLDPAGPVTTLSNLMLSGDRLYDRRYTWIDARINLETGILPRQTRAAAQRVKQQQTTLKALIKLLAVEGG